MRVESCALNYAATPPRPHDIYLELMMDQATVVRRLIVSAIAIVAVVYLGTCAYLWARQRALVYQPQASVRHNPADVKVKFEELDIPVGDGGAIHAWSLPVDSGTSGQATLLYLRGNDGNLGEEVERLAALRRYGLPILAIDYSGFGRSSGPAPSEARLYADATAARDYLVSSQSVDPTRIIVYGHSLGGAVAVELALRRAPVCGVVLESTFTSIADMGRIEYPMIPVMRWLLTERFETLSKIGRLSVPIVFIHGTADEVVPVAMTQQLYQAAQAPKRLILVEGRGHEEAMPAGGQPVAEAIADLARHCSAGH